MVRKRTGGSKKKQQEGTRRINTPPPANMKKHYNNYYNVLRSGSAVLSLHLPSVDSEPRTLSPLIMNYDNIASPKILGFIAIARLYYHNFHNNSPIRTGLNCDFEKIRHLSPVTLLLRGRKDFILSLKKVCNYELVYKAFGSLTKTVTTINSCSYQNKEITRKNDFKGEKNCIKGDFEIKKCCYYPVNRLIKGGLHRLIAWGTTKFINNPSHIGY